MYNNLRVIIAGAISRASFQVGFVCTYQSRSTRYFACKSYGISTAFPYVSLTRLFPLLIAYAWFLSPLSNSFLRPRHSIHKDSCRRLLLPLPRWKFGLDLIETACRTASFIKTFGKLEPLLPFRRFPHPTPSDFVQLRLWCKYSLFCTEVLDERVKFVTGEAGAVACGYPC